MSKKEHIVIYTDKELRAMQLRGEDKSDWKGAAALSSKEVDAAIADGGDEAGMQIDWSTASGELPRPYAIRKNKCCSSLIR